MLQLERKCILVFEVAEDIREIIRRSLENIANWQVLSAIQKRFHLLPSKLLPRTRFNSGLRFAVVDIQ